MLVITRGYLPIKSSWGCVLQLAFTVNLRWSADSSRDGAAIISSMTYDPPVLKKHGKLGSPWHYMFFFFFFGTPPNSVVDFEKQALG